MSSPAHKRIPDEKDYERVEEGVGNFSRRGVDSDLGVAQHKVEDEQDAHDERDEDVSHG
jgi:hypothetical protein